VKKMPAIEVCYRFKTDDGENYKLFETSCELRIGTEYIKSILIRFTNFENYTKLSQGSDFFSLFANGGAMSRFALQKCSSYRNVMANLLIARVMLSLRLIKHKF